MTGAEIGSFYRNHAVSHLGQGEGHVWVIDISQSSSYEDVLSWFLCQSERDRANRLLVEVARTQSIIARGCLRMVLSLYLSCDSGDVVFSYGKHGKPALAASMGKGLQFSLSHTKGLLLIACTQDIPIGVDCESMARVVDFKSLAEKKFFYEEFAWISELEEQDVPDAFWRLWVCKEAAMKVSGVGMSMGWDAFAFHEGLRRGMQRFVPSRGEGVAGLCMLPLASMGCAGALAFARDLIGVQYQLMGVGDLVGMADIS
jgi:4'-phosphopantetheinyl transferase